MIRFLQIIVPKISNCKHRDECLIFSNLNVKGLDQLGDFFASGFATVDEPMRLTVTSPFSETNPVGCILKVVTNYI